MDKSVSELINKAEQKNLYQYAKRHQQDDTGKSIPKSELGKMNKQEDKSRINNVLN